MLTADAVLHDHLEGHLPADYFVTKPATAAATRAIASPTWFEWFFVITGGLVVALPFVAAMGEKALFAQSPINWYLWVSALVSSPHVYATYVRLQRKIVEGKAHWLTGFPLYFGTVGTLAAASLAGFFVEV
ncbi:MAG TPA: hypothetical protein VGG30_04210, partial [Pirellulales bacterium]